MTSSTATRRRIALLLLALVTALTLSGCSLLGEGLQDIGSVFNSAGHAVSH